jgi:hypothetical protein
MKYKVGEEYVIIVGAYEGEIIKITAVSDMYIGGDLPKYSSSYIVLPKDCVVLKSVYDSLLYKTMYNIE